MRLGATKPTAPCHVLSVQVGVSAGGWLARLALGNVPYNGETFGLAPLVHTLVTLGTPHQSLEAYPFGRAEVRTEVTMAIGQQHQAPRAALQT